MTSDAMIRALADHLGTSTLVAAAAATVYWLCRGASARVRCSWLALASLAFLVPFAGLAALGAAVPWPPPRVVTIAAPAQFASADVHLGDAAQTDDARESRRAASVRTVWSAAGAALVIWIGGGLVVMARRAAAMAPARAARRRARPIDHGRVAAAFARSGGPEAGVSLRSSPDCASPGVIGVLRPALLWPEGVGSQLSDAELDAIIAHEVAHVRRRDNLVSAAHAIVEILFWFHPLVWWIGARLADEREHACDETVLQSGAEPDVYAEGILKVCECSIGTPAVGVAAISGARLTQRIEAIMTAHTPRSIGRLPRVLLATAVAGVLAAPVAAGALTKELIQVAPAAPSSTPAPEPQRAPEDPAAPAAEGQSTVALTASSGPQAGTGTVTGVVTDQMGGMVEGATVTLRPSSSTEGQEVRTDRQGRFVITGVRPGSYELRVTFPAFRTTILRDVIIKGGAREVVNPTLKIGALSESVSVSGLVNEAAATSDPSAPAQEAQLLQQIEAAPDDPRGHQMLATFYYRHERYEESAAAMRRAADLIAQRAAQANTYTVTLPSGGNVKEPRKIRDVKPIYPEIARAAKVTGVVIIEATIAEDGTVRDARVLRSVPLLDAAALGAVQQWQFTPTLLNGLPVPVIMTASISFELHDGPGR